MMNQKDQMHPQDQRNMIVFMILALVIYLSYDHFIVKPRMEAARQAQAIAAQQAAINPPVPVEPDRPRTEVVAEGKRVQIDNGRIFGSLNLTGGRLDDIGLHDYYKTLEKKENVDVLSPSGTAFPRYAEFGWVAGDDTVRVPGEKSVWAVKDGGTAIVSADHPVTLEWDNGQGLVFERTIRTDKDFLLTVEQKVTNNSSKPVTLYPYSLISQKGLPEEELGRSIVHQGPIGYVNGELYEPSYHEKKAKIPEPQKAETGWIGITDKYWLAALLPDQTGDKTFRFTYEDAPTKEGKAVYQVDVRGAAQTLAPGKTASSSMRVFAGAKLVKLLGRYEEDLGVHHFDLAVDFGMYYFMTKPFFYLLDFLYSLTGNFGVAIILFTVMLRILVYPLADTSFKSMAKMTKLAPQMTELRDKYGEDKQKLQEELVKLYQREKVNPMAGCLPILIQIPIFFSLYKVLSMTIEMRQAPFFGWVQDLSVRDPTSVFNLFGLVPWTPPGALQIGVWPCLMLVTMIMQRRMSPPPTDPVQAKMITFMPWLMTYLLSRSCSGLVVYWTFNNFFSMIQQYIIRTRMGVPVYLFRSRKEIELERKLKQGPAVHPGLEMIEEEVEDALFGGGEKPEGEPDEKAQISPPKPKRKKKK